MFKGKKILALIPARKGSKGVPGKNKKMIAGKPLISWTIDFAIETKVFDRILVSTNDDDIINIVNEKKLEIPFSRPEDLSTDTSPTNELVIHCIEQLKMKKNEEYDYIVILEPTSPIRDIKDFFSAFDQLLSNSNAKSIVGISKVDAQHPVFLTKKNKDSFISFYEPRKENSIRRQDISPLYFFDGSFYISEVQSFLQNKTFYHDQTLGYELEKSKSFELDDPVDFIIIEALLNSKKGASI
tara:strand:+ start:3840 stop:4562 length:723 start_codon:yes stop_codon:yes gene_type:complete